MYVYAIGTEGVDTDLRGSRVRKDGNFFPSSWDEEKNRLDEANL